MVLRLKTPAMRLLSALVISALFCAPYLLSDFLPLEHDTMFHLSRISGLGEALQRHDILPALYPYKNNGFGYGSPMFYCDVLLIPFSLLYNAGLSLAGTYKLLVFCATLFSVYAMLGLLERFSAGRFPALVTASAFCFSNYRITDVYVRGALGEVMAMGFFILCISASFDILEAQRPKQWKKLAAGLAGLICSHNLTFLFGLSAVLLLFLLYARHAGQNAYKSLAKALLAAFAATVWFTIPMLEQLASQRFILSYYASSSQLERYALPLWKYTANNTVFGYGNNDIEPERQMLVNIGWWLSACGLLYGAVRKKLNPSSRFTDILFGIGVICFLLPWDIVPWKHLSILRIIQFPWRLMTPALILLAVPAMKFYESRVHDSSAAAIIACVLLLLEGAVHLLPVKDRTFGITSDTAYNEIISGELVDPYYAASYMRVELAGGEYLPENSPDFRGLVPAVYDSSGLPLIDSFTHNGTTFTAAVSTVPQDSILELPLTYYKGYSAYLNGQALPVIASPRGLVQVNVPSSGTLTVTYEGTKLRSLCIIISALFFAGAAVSTLISFLLHRRPQTQ